MRSEMFSGGERVDTGDGNVGNRFERVLSAMPDFLTHMKLLKSRQKKETMGQRPAITQNKEMQAIYDRLSQSEDNYDLLDALRKYNIVAEKPFLASSQNGYFSEQIEESGMAGLKIKQQDIEDANTLQDVLGGMWIFGLGNCRFYILHYLVPRN